MNVRISLIVLFAAFAGCATVSDKLGVAGGQLVRASIATNDGAHIALWRWTPTTLDAPRLLVLPEFGFDHRLVTPLCAKLRTLGYDVATLDGREVTRDHGRYAGLAGWRVDVARAAATHRPDTIVAIGIAGAASLPFAAESGAHQVVAVNVPLRRAIGNDALRWSLDVDGYDPRIWFARGKGSLLLGRGRSTPSRTASRLSQLALPLSPDLAAGIVAFLREGGRDELPRVPVSALVSMKDNLVDSEDALPDGGRGFAHMRRLALLEGFSADYGHLDWLVETHAVDEAAEAIVEEIEAMR